ncbi:hypothetical protein HRbin15_02562 [bacterium HR15]|nr:hypothetical protein HRbin15_02562 [bacterium HR15]
MQKAAIETLHIEGFLSIRQTEITLGDLCILIGSNGAGKSNLMRLFRLLQSIADGSLQRYVAEAGGADALLHYGRKHTDHITISICFRRPKFSSDTLSEKDTLPNDFANSYLCRLIPGAGDTLYIVEETIGFHDRQLYPRPYTRGQQAIRPESFLVQLEQVFDNSTDKGIARHVRDCLLSYRVYHFHDTSSTARMKQRCYIYDNTALHADAGNLAAMLLRMREEHPERYEHLLEFIRLAAPFFGDFVLDPMHARVLLRWRERGFDKVFPPDALSDGTLRFICLATLLMQPPEWMPATILIDEPELGLHPFAIGLIGEAMRSASQVAQVVVSTQSPLLLDLFKPEEVIVVERIDGSSEFRRLESNTLQDWLHEYSMGEIWEKNLIGGRPPR